MLYDAHAEIIIDSLLILTNKKYNNIPNHPETASLPLKGASCQLLAAQHHCIAAAPKNRHRYIPADRPDRRAGRGNKLVACVKGAFPL